MSSCHVTRRDDNAATNCHVTDWEAESASELHNNLRSGRSRPLEPMTLEQRALHGPHLPQIPPQFGVSAPEKPFHKSEKPESWYSILTTTGCSKPGTTSIPPHRGKTLVKF
ncbi:hypothetical protein PAAG_03111 [Paracoccidioides lutzii Pb01]|uniref:Uncharacterized protein n=1 Tax=Paracoccidioides lutzii (strain ATCC MYA-826 / Pb01) TaxID=502779 RepID=C1GYF7_PARBA|nr:hypothetical protein PAAG_03111 [Paracoccidioides lutzii Pb01]EEH41548.1 hypothetical protein PAAG_03111 [Paracoccidioides lutzii Pb01]